VCVWYEDDEDEWGMSGEVGLCLLDGMLSFVFPLQFAYGILVKQGIHVIQRQSCWSFLTTIY